uniref:Uncharacterized protein n=1 Tax=viral metagenome TaxID=1070528 RepID=A0A6M3IK59_9ZZZZ
MSDITYILENGTETKREPSDQFRILGKIVVGFFKSVGYYVRVNDNTLIDPSDRDTRRHVNRNSKFRKVKKEVFKSYLAFLRTQYKMHLYQAEREL